MMRSSIIAFVTTFLGGCALIEPSAQSQFSAKLGTSEEAVFKCVEATIRSLKNERFNWVDRVTTRDLQSGIFETGNFSDFNHVGIRTQVIYTKSTGKVQIKVKASGPYFMDLGAKQATNLLVKGISECL